jgi:hypothetical protein
MRPESILVAYDFFPLSACPGLTSTPPTTIVAAEVKLLQSGWKVAAVRFEGIRRAGLIFYRLEHGGPTLESICKLYQTMRDRQLAEDQSTGGQHEPN